MFGEVGDKLEAKQARPTARRVKDGNPVYVSLGNQFPYPGLLETNNQSIICPPTGILSVAMQ